MVNGSEISSEPIKGKTNETRRRSYNTEGLKINVTSHFSGKRQLDEILYSLVGLNPKGNHAYT